MIFYALLCFVCSTVCDDGDDDLLRDMEYFDGSCE